MRNLLALVGLLVVGFGAIGWYCGWYKLSVTRTQDGNVQIKTDVDPKKVGEDTSAFFEKVGQVVGEKGAEKGTPAPAAGGNGFEGGWLLGPAKPAGGPSRPPGDPRP